MRPSIYLNAIEIGDGNSLLYNGRSLCIDVVPSRIAHRLVSSRGPGRFSYLTSAEIQVMLGDLWKRYEVQLKE